MEKRNYTHVQTLLPEIKAMLAEGKTQREVAEHYEIQEKPGHFPQLQNGAADHEEA